MRSCRLRWPTTVTSNTNSHIKNKFPTSKTNSPHQNQIYHIKHKFATAKAKSSQQKQYSPHQKRNCHSKNKFLTSKANLLHQNPKHRLNDQRSMNESYLQFSLGLHPTAILFPQFSAVENNCKPAFVFLDIQQKFY